MKKRKLLFLMTVLFTGLLFSCKTEEPEEIIEYNPGMNSFGFYMEDNEGVIFEDYQVAEITGTSISVMMPEEVDKSKLVARFTVNANNTVRVGTVDQVSGETANDFTAPVDYIVTEGTDNIRYTVTIEKAPAFVWTSMGTLEDAEVVSQMIKISPDGVPYLIYKMKGETTADDVLGAYVMKNGQWTSLGQVSEGRTESSFDITFDSNNNPVVSYLDHANTIAKQASVKKYSGTSWSFVGDAEATSNLVSHNAISYADNNKLMLFAQYDARDNVLVRRELTVNINEGGSAWTHNQSIPGRAPGQTAYFPNAVKVGDAVYLGIFNATSGDHSVSLYKYENNSWSILMDNWADEQGGVTINVRDFNMDADKDGNVYFLFADNSAEEYKHRVIKYDAESKKVSDVGNLLEGTSGNVFNFDIAVSPFGVPFVFFRNTDKFPTVVSFDKDTQDWTTPKVLETNEGNELSIDFMPDGKALLTYVRDRKVYTYKYDTPGN